MPYQIAVVADAPLDRLSPRSSAAAVCAALEKAGHRATVVPLGDGLAAALRDLAPDCCVAALDERRDLARSGAVAELLEFLGIPFVGADSAACRGAWDRAALARIAGDAAARGELDAALPPTVRLSRSCFDAMDAAGALSLVEQRIPAGFPLAVRAGRGHDARRVETPAELAYAVQETLVHDDTVLVQEWVEGVSVRVAILGDEDDLVVLPPAEALCDRPQSAGDWRVPVSLEKLHADRSQAEGIRSEIERAALDLYYACRARDLGVVDLVWDGARAQAIGIDLGPSWGAGSVVELGLEAAQIDLAEVLGALVEQAVERA
jgi:D-alanine-D-alanine ligase